MSEVLNLDNLPKVAIEWKIFLAIYGEVCNLKLKKESIIQAIEHVYNDSDTDLFSKPKDLIHAMFEKVTMLIPF